MWKLFQELRFLMQKFFLDQERISKQFMHLQGALGPVKELLDRVDLVSNQIMTDISIAQILPPLTRESPESSATQQSSPFKPQGYFSDV